MMKTFLISAAVLVFLFGVSDAENCTGFPEDLIGIWTSSGDSDMINGKYDINAENMTRMNGGESSQFQCLLFEDNTYVLKKIGGNDKQYMCLAYKNINDNALMTYTKNANSDDTPSSVGDICDEDLMKYPKPGNMLYADSLAAVECSLIGKFQFDTEDCANKTYTLEACSGDFTSMTFFAACDGLQNPFANGSMDCLGSWDGEDGLKYAFVKTASIADTDTEWTGKFACMAYTEPDANNTLLLTAQDFQCGEDQTETMVDDGGFAVSMEKVNTEEECTPATTDGGNSIMVSFVSSMVCLLTALKL